MCVGGHICLVSAWGEGSSSIFAVDRLNNHRDVLTLVPSILESTGEFYTSSGVLAAMERIKLNNAKSGAGRL